VYQATSADGTVDDGINAVWNVYATIGFPCKSKPPEVVVTPVVTIAGSEGPHPLYAMYAFICELNVACTVDGDVILNPLNVLPCDDM